MTENTPTPQRRSGVLMHITSLPNEEGMGTLGPEAHAFLDRLAEGGQRVWQILPLNPTQGDGSPYAALSSFAGAEHVISLELLAAEGLLSQAELAPLRGLDTRQIDFSVALPLRRRLVALAASRFAERADRDAFAAFEAFRDAAGPAWLDDYALFRAVLEAQAWADWSDWPAPLRAREPAALAAARISHAARIEEIAVEQFLFDRQWRALRAHAASRGIEMFGDMPIYVAQSSADVWTAPHLFQLTPTGKPKAVAGCPPDMMAATGQRWGNPVYDWGAMERDGFAWWIARMQRMLEWFDLVRIDHFRAFASYWEIPATCPDATEGVWVPAPGYKLFEALKARFSELPVVAEDLGFITPDVYELRDAFAFPGMHIIQYDLEEEPLAPERLPAAYPARSIAYFGNHDNDTAIGWLDRQRGLSPEEMAQRPLLAAALHAPEPHWVLNRLALTAGSDLAVLQMQDLLGLPGAHRFNVPGTATGNWGWRLLADEAPQDLWLRLRAESCASGRADPMDPSGHVPEGSVLQRLLSEVDAEFLSRQHPVTGLLPAGTARNRHGDYSHAWVRDNCYCVLAIWAAASACRRADQPKLAKRYKESTERVMRGLFAAMQGQAAKVERFIETGSRLDALHAKYDATTGRPTHGDEEWGHLQLDATSLFLLLCADMTAGGLSIIRTRAEAEFLERLCAYVARTWRTADYGMWERGDKRNIGLPERNSTSVGLARAALAALPRTRFQLDDDDSLYQAPAREPAELALFDESLRGMLPEESWSKEVDAGLLTVVGYPAYAAPSSQKALAVRAAVSAKLAGRYGHARFLKDGHQTPVEETTRLHYEPGELERFAGIESQWPLFIAFEALDAAARGADQAAKQALNRLTRVSVLGPSWPLMPEMYLLEREQAGAEKEAPGSQPRLPNDNVPLYWAQSLSLTARFLIAGLIKPEDIDPLQRREAPKPAAERASQAQPLHRLLARGLKLRDASGAWRDVLSPGAVEGRGFEPFGEPLLRMLAQSAEPLEQRWRDGVVGLDLPALSAPGRAARLAGLPALDEVLRLRPNLDWSAWREDVGALLPIGGVLAAAVWRALDRCTEIVFPSGFRLPAALCQADHTEGERAFAHKLLDGLAGTDDLQLRALTLEALGAFAASPGLRAAGALDLSHWFALAGTPAALLEMPPWLLRTALGYFRHEVILAGMT